MDDTADKQRRLDELKTAFESFSSASSHLEASYRDLEAQVETLRSQLEAARRERADETRRLTAVLEALPGGVVMLDESGIVRRINAAALELLGDPLKDTEWQAVCRRAFRHQAGEHGDLTLDDGRRVSLAHRDMRPGPGRVLLLTDVTENRKFQALVDRHRRLAAMGEMAAALAHQIRTPLSAALLYTSSATRPELTPERRDDLLNKATGCLTDLEQLIGDMLHFARGAGEANGRFTIGNVLAAVDRSLRPVLAAGQRLDIDCADTELGMTGNREALIGAILNLANNALQAAGADARVVIGARRDGTGIAIRVADNGPGIEPDEAERIFDPFYTSRTEGTGLGLAVVRSVVQSHGGDVALESINTGSGAGATFVLRLPVHAQPAAIAATRVELAEDAA